MPPRATLQDIVARKRLDVEARQERAPLHAIRADLPPSDRSLVDALVRPRTGFIMECKQGSPSAGTLRADYDPVDLARAYEPFADAISVIIDTPFFGGEPAHLAAVRAFTRHPVLCKDFVVDPYQVFEARRLGADAILLMLSVLDDATYEVCRAAADALSMDVLTEVHDDDELDRALRLRAAIIGVNARDLRTFEVDLDRARRLLPRIPAGTVRVAESGIGDHGDVRSLRASADAFLVGTALVRSGDVPRTARELVFGRAKTCGLTTPEDAATAWEAGATWGGLIFAPASPRRVSPGQAAAVRAAAPLQWVGVFVNEEVDAVAARARHLALDAVQLHGDEDASYATRLRPLLPARCEIWKAWRLPGPGSPPEDVGRLDVRAADVGADRLLLDRLDRAARGGTGRTFDWDLVRAHPELPRMVLGGGLNPSNARAADETGAWAVDVASGVEAAPGRKDPARVGEFFDQLRGAIA